MKSLLGIVVLTLFSVGGYISYATQSPESLWNGLGQLSDEVLPDSATYATTTPADEQVPTQPPIVGGEKGRYAFLLGDNEIVVHNSVTRQFAEEDCETDFSINDRTTFLMKCTWNGKVFNISHPKDYIHIPCDGDICRSVRKQMKEDGLIPEDYVITYPGTEYTD